MSFRCIGIHTLAVTVLVGAAFADGKRIKSGLKPGDFALPFRCLSVTGPDKDDVLCLVCKNGDRPLAMVFANEISDPLKTLLKRLDLAVERNRQAELASFAVFLTADPDSTENSLKELAEKEKISENVPLVIPEIPTGPPHYKISKDADVTVMLFKEGKVVRNFAFAPKKLTKPDVERIVASLATILPRKGEQ